MEYRLTLTVAKTNNREEGPLVFITVQSTQRPGSASHSVSRIANQDMREFTLMKSTKKRAHFWPNELTGESRSLLSMQHRSECSITELVEYSSYAGPSAAQMDEYRWESDSTDSLRVDQRSLAGA
jgi:hypothetical protein